MKGIQPHFQNIMALVSLGDQTFWSLIGKTKFSSNGTPASVSLFLTYGSTKITCLAFVLKSCWSIGVGILPKPVHLEGRSSLFVSPQIPHRYAIIIIDCIIIIILKSSYNLRNMSPTYFRASQYEAMITYFQHKFLQLLCVVYEVPFPFYSECMHELLSFRTAFISCHFFKRVSFTRFKDYRKCCNHFINLTLVQFRECENC